MSSPTHAPAHPTRPTSPRARQPRPDSLVFNVAELCWTLGISIRHFKRHHARIPQPLTTLSRRAIWSREEIESWVKNGCPPPQ
jgi:hypothetical protein